MTSLTEELEQMRAAVRRIAPSDTCLVCEGAGEYLVHNVPTVCGCPQGMEALRRWADTRTHAEDCDLDDDCVCTDDG